MSITNTYSIPVRLELKGLGEGMSSKTYESDNLVIKTGKVIYKNYNDALDAATQMRSETDLLLEHLGPKNVVETHYGIYSSAEGAKVLIAQPFIKGVFLSVIRDQDKVDFSEIISFLQACSTMYKKTGYVPDLFGWPAIPNWFNPLFTQNVLILEESQKKGRPKPVLIDTAFSRKSRKYPHVRGVLNSQIIRSIHSLEKRQGLSNCNCSYSIPTLL